MDILEEYIQDNLLSKDNILRFVDDYSIYSFYIGSELELRTKYSSPLRKGDADPSFSIFNSTRSVGSIMFKDNATGKSGNVFKFVQELMSNGELTSIKRVLLQINSDFGIGLGDEEVGEFKPKLLKAPPIQKSPTEIQITNYPQVTKAFEEYWDTLDISNLTLQKYYCTNPKIVHYIADFHSSFTTGKELTIAYEILGKYKIYSPFAKREFKFRNNYSDNFTEGMLQLEFKQEFCIITKAMKECMFFYEHFRWETVAGKSENTMINPYSMEVLRVNYKTVFIFLDSDKAGIAAQLKYINLYPWLVPIVMDSSIIQKDITDLYTAAKPVGQAEQVLSYIKQLILNNV